jgi:serine/threonine-protein kinase RsbT
VERLAYDIRGKDFSSAGHASRELKQHLKRLGAEPDAVRRAMIAAYEAEMNVVIHADGGNLQATVSAGQLDVDVVDRGPGIADIAKAMTEGWSTATADARALGFGAGMGLPNIQRNSDRLRVTSTVGEGTRVSFTIKLRPAAAGRGARPSSLGVVAELCKDCRRCLVACPTAAIRVRDGRPEVLNHLCVDCTACIAACPTGALTMLDAAELDGGPDGVLAVPAGLLAGFAGHTPADVFGEAGRAGRGAVLAANGYEAALRAAVVARAAAETPLPVISPVCPAVVNLIELKYPALVSHLAPLASPWAALQRDLDGRDVTFVVSCPAQRSELLAQQTTEQRRVVTARLAEELLSAQLAARGRRPADAALVPVPPGPQDGVLQVSGVPHVLAVLERIEDGLLGGVAAVEPYICDGGCFGSPLLPEDVSLSAWRWASAPLPGDGVSVTRDAPFKPRPGIRLDADMSVAIAKLARLDAELATLPGRDCGACGAPSCAALAEDIVMERAVRAACPYVPTEEESAS